MNVIRTINIEKTYNPDKVPVKALRGIDLSIEKGEFTAIVGPSGSGKSTLLNIIGGLDRPTKGEVTINEENILGLSDNQLIDFRRDHIGFVFQAYNLIPVFTTRENVEFVMELQKWDKSERKQRADDLIHALGLDDQKDKKPGEMSGGQQQRVAVARALASKPNFILADEPTANLDSKSASNLLEMMLKLNQEEQTTFIFSTHDQRVMDKARRVVTLEDGKIVSDDRK